MGIKQSLTDSFGRRVRYLRVSITDRCNLRCSYCAVDPNFTFIPHSEILTYEEILKLADAAVLVGVDKIRLTGGEPFARKGFVEFLQQLRTNQPHLNIRITTNGTLLSNSIEQLERAKINALNISLDTFKASRFTSISGQNLHEKALQGLFAAINSSLTVKVNCVALKGINEDELEDFVLFAKEHEIDVRFIELMPLGGHGGWKEESLWSGSDIIERASKIVTLTPVKRDKSNSPESQSDNGPASMYSIEGSKGRIGVISPLTNHFCDDCNRLRVTADGRLRTCLFSDKEYPLRELLRTQGVSQEEVIAFLKESLIDKPIGADLLAKERKKGRIITREMSSIGG